MSAILLSLAAGVVWGTSDFLGGLAARRLVVLAVIGWSQLVGLALVLVIVVAGGYDLGGDGVLWGVGAGVIGSLALALFYAGLAAGAMSLVAPLTACGALVPVAVALLGGERLEALTVVGMALALLGAVLVSRTEGPSPRLGPRVVGMAVAAGVAFGLVITMLQQGAGGGDDGASLTVVLAARVASLVATWGALAVTRTSPRVGSVAMVPLLIAVGLGDTGANVLLAFASGGGEDALVAVLASLYPVVTVLLARGVLGERLSGWQATGVAAALAGVAIVSAA